ncbi:2-hydroxyacid dehydrogenase [Alteribacillus iranensis]|uniref:Gluconate 2-dehydrogenase n=1 Tax=Alteribacillus iranensis TaxID=930128 RepID=A0A1I2BL62_9BACI|nr:D-glycerate dehydrogenase [Alteribacillus iranensis]SFE56739.1 gluconate 2-dehydrogenase [Alteribacillus iranensis]
MAMEFLLNEKQKIVAYNRVSPVVLEELSDRFDVSYFTEGEYIFDPDFRNALQEAVGIIGVDMKVSDDLLKLAPHLKVVSNVSVGYDNLDIDALTKYRVAACHTPGVLTDTTADAIFSLLMATARRIPELDRYVKEGQWKSVLPMEKFGTDIHHKTLGIIGMGRIGEAIAKRAYAGFDMNIMYHSRTRKIQVEEKYEASYASLEELLETADFVCLITPLTLETRNLMGPKEFKKMKASAIFINGSRGGTVDEEALVKALEANEIRAAGLDVFQNEPISGDHPLFTLPNLVTTPHIGAATIENEYRMASLAAKNLVDALDGKRPEGVLNPEIYDDYIKEA